jgi:hypothetical protein
MRSYLRALPMLLLPALPIYASLWGAHSGWTDYWLLEDARQSVAVVTKEWTGPKGTSVGYAYEVDERTYSGLAGRNYDAEQGQLVRDVHVGDRLTIYFSESHPWLSSAYRPKSRFEAVEMLAQPFLFALIGVGCAGWYVIRVWNRRHAPTPGLRAPSRSRFEALKPGATTTRALEMRVNVFKSLDELPPELRDKLEVDHTVRKSHFFQFTGANGRKQTFHSLAEMPPDLRARFEEAIKDRQAAVVSKDRPHNLEDMVHSLELWDEPDAAVGAEGDNSVEEIPPSALRRFEEAIEDAPPGESFMFRFRGPDGREQTFHSLEELPPEARAIYDQLMHPKSSVTKSHKPKHS